MRRAVPVLVATVIGLALLLQYHTSPQPLAALPPVTLPEPATTSTSSSTSESTTETTTAAVPVPSAPASCVSSAGGIVVVDGPLANNPYGDVQVRLHLSDGLHIDDIEALTMPNDLVRSRRISYDASGVLHSEVLAAQSADIDTVSGATYTSDSYRTSLQGALDQAGQC